MTAADNKRLTKVLRDTSDDLLKYFARRIGLIDAADALSEVMTGAWSRVASLPEDETEARMWLFGIARNTLLHAQRTEVRQSKLADRLRAAAEQRSSPPSDSGLEVRDALTRIPEDLAELIMLVHWDGFSIAEVGQLLDIPASTARSRYQRAKNVLAQILRPEPDAERDKIVTTSN